MLIKQAEAELCQEAQTQLYSQASQVPGRVGREAWEAIPEPELARHTEQAAGGEGGEAGRQAQVRVQDQREEIFLVESPCLWRQKAVGRAEQLGTEQEESYGVRTFH